MGKISRAEGAPTVTKIYDDVIDDVIKVNPNFTFFVDSDVRKKCPNPSKMTQITLKMCFEVFWVTFTSPGTVGTEEKFSRFSLIPTADRADS